MNTTRYGIIAAIVLAILLVAGPWASLAMAGPAQEKGQEEPKEEKEKPKKFTNQDLRKSSSSSSSGGEGEAQAAGDEGAGGQGAEGEAGEAAEGEADPWDTVGVATDSQGRGEAYWRQAMSDARGAVVAAKQKRDQLQDEMNRNRVDFTAIDDPAARALVHERIEELFGELAEADQAVATAEQALRDLEEDARRSGALPGWLR